MRWLPPTILNSPLKDLTIRWETSLVMMGTGGLMSMKTAMSLLVGAIINYVILAPILIQSGVIHAAKFKDIAMWSMWGGASMMTTASLFSFFSKPQMLIQSFTRAFSKVPKDKDQLAHIELPMWVFLIGIPIIGGLTVWMGHVYFGVHYWLGIIAIPLVFIFTLIAVTSTGLTSITPGGALGKLTQISYSIMAPGNIPTNLMTAGITSEVSLNASNLLMDIKPGYMLGAKPRQQAVGHVLGIFAGGVTSVYAFYYLFHGDIAMFTSDKMPLPGAMIWKAVAEVLGKGLSTLHPTAQVAVLVGGVIGLVLEIIGKKTKGKFPLTGVGLGLGFVLQFFNSLAMALGALFFWVAKKKVTDKNSLSFRALIENQETLCAGIIAGGSIIGIILALVEAAG